MGTKYTTQATSGYNSGPPADDGSQSASNLITWAGIKTKLADVLKTFGESINTALVAVLNTSVRQITAADSTVAGDHWRTVEIAPTVSNTVTVSLGDAATMTSTYLLTVRNSSTIAQVISRVTGGDTIDGVAANLAIPSKSSISFSVNAAATGYLTVSDAGIPFVDSNPVVKGSADATKQVRFEVDGLTTATTRVITVPDANVTLGLGAAAGVGQTFLAADVLLNNTANYFNTANTGSIGASGQVWLLIATATLDDTAGAAQMRVRIWDTSTVFAETVAIVPAAGSQTTVTLHAIVSPSAAATYHLSVKDNSSASGVARTTGNAGTANKATSITAIRLV